MGFFLLLRHEETDWEMTLRKGMVGHQQDFVPLTSRGEKRAEKLGFDPRLTEAEIIIASPYTRALQTAALLNKKLNLPIKVEFDLHEILPDKNRHAHSVEGTLKLCRDFDKHYGCYPRGEERQWESLESAANRVLTVFARYKKFGKVLAVTHEKVIKSLVGWREVSHGEIIPYNPEQKDE